MADRLAKILAEMRQNPGNIRFADLMHVCEQHFGEPRSHGTSHVIFKMPWPGDPRVNIQNKGGKAKPYQVKQVLIAIEKLEGAIVSVADHYTYRVHWSAEDDEYVGTAAELPSVSWLAEDRMEAFIGIQRVAEEIVAEMLAAGEEPPVALADKHYSGKFLVRVPADVHRRLAVRAAEQGISLNALASSRLAGV